MFETLQTFSPLPQGKAIEADNSRTPELENTNMKSPKNFPESRAHGLLSKTLLCGMLAASLSVIGCAAEDDVDSLENAPINIEQVVGELDSSWEPTALPVTVSEDMPNIDILKADTPEAREQLAIDGERDKTWRSANGDRYTSMLVLPDGSSYGRTADAAGATPPSMENDFGAATMEDFDVVAQRIWTDTSLDDRYRSSSTSTFSRRVVGSLSSSGNTQSGGCTATKIGPRALLTASHCILNGTTGNITTSGWFNPGQTSTTTPNGSFRWRGAYLRDHRLGRKYDYAVLFLDDNSSAVGLGWMGVNYWNSESSYTGKVATLRGYPCGSNRSCGQITAQRCAASPRADKRCDGWMYSHSASIPSNSWSVSGELRINNDGSSGQSGSAVFRNNAVLGTYWGSRSGQNYATRFRQSMWNDVCGWIGSVPSAFGSHSLCN